MPALANAPPDPIKAIIAAESGTGKTGSLWSLADAGFKLKIFDADRGAPILASILKDNPKALANVEVCSFTDKYTRDTASGFMKPAGTPKAWSGMIDALNKWPDDPKTGICDWGWDTVAVFDSLTMFSRRALTYAQFLEGKGRWKPELQHYGVAMAQIEALFGQLYGDHVKCHVLWLTHVKQEYKTTDLGDGKTQEEWVGAFPSTIGKALNAVIPRYVNDILTVKVTGEGPNSKRYISTKPVQNRLMTKTHNINVKDQYLFADGRTPKPGLAEFFADCGWSAPNDQ